MRATVILRSIGHKCFPKKKKKKRSSPVVRVIAHSLASKNSKRAADGRQKSHMRLRSRRLPTYELWEQNKKLEDKARSFLTPPVTSKQEQKT